MFCFCVEDLEYFKSEPEDNCAMVTIKIETGDFTVLKAADNELAGIDDNDVMRMEHESECVTPGVVDLQPHDTGDCEILFLCLFKLLFCRIADCLRK